METTSGNKMDKLSNLGARLLEAEREYVKCDDGADVARQDLLDALGQYHSSRFRFGKVLAAYKVFFAEERTWMQVAKLIGRAIDRDERTIRRIIEDYEHASQVPVEVIEELEALGVDPAAKKNAPVLTNILEMPLSDVKAELKEVVAHAVKTAKVKKTAAVKKPNQPVTALETPVSAPLTRVEKQRRHIRLKIQTALNDVPNDQKLVELIAALEEEMYEVWGERDSKEITLTPRPSALTIDGRRKLEVAA